MRVIVIAGTADARKIIEALLKHGDEVVATVTTGYGKELLSEYHGIEVLQGKLDASEMYGIIKSRSVKCLVDASHPFAREASVNAIEACKNSELPYLRFERSSMRQPGENVTTVSSFVEAAEEVRKVEGNIFLAIGSNNLKYFTEAIPDFKRRLVARVLPDSRMLAKCEEAGLTADNIIAVKGPFSAEMNFEMLKHFKASVLVTKESGNTGGTPEKLEAADKLNIPVIMVNRPEVDYGRKAETLAEVLQFIEEVTGMG